MTSSTGPETRYASSAGLNIAYQVFGSGPLDLVLVPGFISHVEFAWQEPLLARFLRKLSAFTRVIATAAHGAVGYSTAIHPAGLGYPAWRMRTRAHRN
jgi:putative intracellular protease/amidase